jgi:pyruvate-formate lyase
MAADDKGLDRRGFLKAGAAALGGGLLFLGTETSVEARIQAEESLKRLDFSPFTVPRRLSNNTHELARRGLSGEWGGATVAANLKIEDLVDCARLSEEMKYAHSIRLIAERAPLRIEPCERVVGSATYREATAHSVPIYNKSSVSHTTIGYDRVLKEGYKGIRQRVEGRLARGGLDEKGKDLLNAMLICLDAADTWHRRYVAELRRRVSTSSGEERDNYEAVLEALRSVPANPPRSFREAVQSLWFAYAFQRLAGNWTGIGRIDEMLGPYLKHDLETGKISLDEARELIAHFWIRGTEWIGSNPWQSSGDAQFYQNIVLGGIDAQGNEVTNEVTYLVLDVVEELHISDFPIAVRLNRGTPKKLLRRIAEVQRQGGGIVAVYNEEVVIDALVKFGYPVEEARCFANDGCWEALIPGKTTFSYVPFDTLALLQEVLGFHSERQKTADYADFESLYKAFEKRLREHLDWHHGICDSWCVDGPPATLISLLVDDCIERGRGYHDRGSRYCSLAPHAGGIANTANSLLTIRKLVYEEKLLTLSELVEILRANWQGQENLRKLVLNRVPTYGNDDDEADAMVKRVFDSFTGIAAEVKERKGVLRPAGISTFGREIEWRAHRKATADGHLQGEILATNFSPSPGTDRKGPTAMLKSYCKMDYTKLPNIGTLELKILPSSVKGEAGVTAMVGLMKSLVRMGGCFMHVDVVDSAMLLDAQRHPEKYPNLAVRIAGWSARFATLDKNWQDMVIGRTQQVV